MRTVMVEAAEAEAEFLRLLEAVEAGEEIVFTRAGRPVARMVPHAGAPVAAPASSGFSPVG